MYIIVLMSITYDRNDPDLQVVLLAFYRIWFTDPLYDTIQGLKIRFDPSLDDGQWYVERTEEIVEDLSDS